MRRQPHLTTTTVATVAMLLLTSCGHTTSGTAAPQRTSASSAAAPTPRPSAATATSSPSAPSDEDQVKVAVTAFQDAYNTENWEAYGELMCAAMRAQFSGNVMGSVKKGRATNGPATIKSMTVAIDGDDATATLTGVSEGLGPGTITMPLKREDGWKVCKVFRR